MYEAVMSAHYPGGQFCAKITPLIKGGFSLICFVGVLNEQTGIYRTIPIHENPGPFRAERLARREARGYADIEGFRASEIEFE
jgi:hypothetical protein